MFDQTEGTIQEVQRSTLQVCFEWRIERFHPSRYNYWIQCPRISFNDSSWFMIVIPNRKRWLNLQLIRKNVGSSVAVEMAVCVRGSKGEEHKEERKEEFIGFRFYQVWDEDSAPKMADLSRLLQEDGALVLRCELKIDAEDDAKTLAEIQSSVKEAMEELHSSLRRLYESGEGCDVVMKVQDKEFPAHKLILQMRSPVFQAMFTHDMLEKQLNTVNIEDLDQDSFPSFLEHIYTGSVAMISTSNVFSLFRAADKYDLRSLKKECSQFMRRNMTVTSFCDVIRIAVKHNEKELIEHATEFFCGNSLVIVKTPDWQIFLDENPTVGNELVIKAFSNYENIIGGTK